MSRTMTPLADTFTKPRAVNRFVFGLERCQVDRAQTICALKDAFAQAGFLDVAKLDHLLFDREKPFVKFKPVGIKAILSPAIIHFLADIGDNWNCKEGD